MTFLCGSTHDISIDQRHAPTRAATSSRHARGVRSDKRVPHDRDRRPCSAGLPRSKRPGQVLLAHGGVLAGIPTPHFGLLRGAISRAITRTRRGSIPRGRVARSRTGLPDSRIGQGPHALRGGREPTGRVTAARRAHRRRRRLTAHMGPARPASGPGIRAIAAGRSVIHSYPQGFRYPQPAHILGISQVPTPTPGGSPSKARSRKCTC
jgi:hypothetical protein